jgi:antitoxin CptB
MPSVEHPVLNASNPPSLLDERSLSKLKWRCRRGLLENDLFIERFFARHEASLNVRQAKGMDDLMDLSDNDLLDLLLQRKAPEALDAVSASTEEAREVLALMIVPAHKRPQGNLRNETRR